MLRRATPARARRRQLAVKVYEGVKRAAPTVGQKAVALADEAIKALTS